MPAAASMVHGAQRLRHAGRAEVRCRESWAAEAICRALKARSRFGGACQGSQGDGARRPPRSGGGASPSQGLLPASSKAVRRRSPMRETKPCGGPMLPIVQGHQGARCPHGGVAGRCQGGAGGGGGVGRRKRCPAPGRRGPAREVQLKWALIRVECAPAAAMERAQRGDASASPGRLGGGPSRGPRRRSMAARSSQQAEQKRRGRRRGTVHGGVACVQRCARATGWRR